MTVADFRLAFICLTSERWVPTIGVQILRNLSCDKFFWCWSKIMYDFPEMPLRRVFVSRLDPSVEERKTYARNSPKSSMPLSKCALSN